MDEDAIPQYRTLIEQVYDHQRLRFFRSWMRLHSKMMMLRMWPMTPPKTAAFFDP
jgi:hypothetical protein